MIQSLVVFYFIFALKRIYSVLATQGVTLYLLGHILKSFFLNVSLHF